MHFVYTAPAMDGAIWWIRILVAFLTIGLSEGFLKMRKTCAVCGKSSGMKIQIH